MRPSTYVHPLLLAAVLGSCAIAADISQPRRVLITGYDDHAMAPFGQPEHVPGLGDYVEGPAFSADERLLYFHRKDGARFNLYAMPIR